MIKLTHWIVRRFIANYRQTDHVEVRAKYGSLEANTSIYINLLLFAVKLVLGLSVRSVAVIADAVHTLSDTGTSIIILIGFRIAKKPSDKEHPFGHGRAEPIKGFHDLRIVGQEAKVSVIFDITLSEQVNRQEVKVIVEQLREAMVKQLPDVRLDIKAEPRFAYSSSNRIGHRDKNR